ncbi:MAG: hypothetical protein M1827_000328 [Pycnora praestabilis]|nr:MAG: hypothetical protein M1827_000328 [Pycnora praestabilis]
MSTMPTITGRGTPEPINILLINPNSTSSMTTACLQSLESTLPTNCTVAGFTAPLPAPSAIEGHLDGVLSAAACIRAITPIAHQYDGFLVACFSDHPLIKALREEVQGPVIGIMEASLYAARMLGGRFGIVTTSARSQIMMDDAIRNYGLEGVSAGPLSTGLGVLELETKPRDEVLDRVQRTAELLVELKGADCIALGCAGMTDMKERCENTLPYGVEVLDGVRLGVQFLIGLVREGLETAKSGIYKSAEEGRQARGQEWL